MNEWVDGGGWWRLKCVCARAGTRAHDGLYYRGARLINKRTLKVDEVALLVELGALETERVDDVVDLDGLVLKGLLTLLGGGVGTNVDLDGALLNHGAVGLIGDAIADLSEVVRVRDDLVAGDDILLREKKRG